MRVFLIGLILTALVPLPMFQGGGFTYITAGAATSSDNTNINVNGLNTTGADLLVALVNSAVIEADGTMSDNKSNTWTLGSMQNIGQSPCNNSSTGAGGIFYYSKPSSVGSSHNFQYTRSGTYSSMEVFAFSGSAASSVFDQSVCNQTLGTSSTSGQPGSLTISSNYLALTSLGNPNDSATPTINSSFNNSFTLGTDYTHSIGGEGVGSVTSYRILTSGATLNPTWTWTSNGGSSLFMATFKVGSGPSPSDKDHFFFLLHPPMASLMPMRDLWELR